MKLLIERIIGGQGAGDNQGVASSCLQGTGQLFLGIRVVPGAGDQQLVPPGAGALLQKLCETGITGVFQVRQDKTEGATCTTTKGSSLGINLEMVIPGHLQHLVDGLLLDSAGRPLAIDDIAGRGTGYPGQAGKFCKGHGAISSWSQIA